MINDGWHIRKSRLVYSLPPGVVSGWFFLRALKIRWMQNQSYSKFCSQSKSHQTDFPDFP